MKKFLLLILVAFSVPARADINLEPLLNKVVLQLQAEQWITTKTALVDVSINAAVTDQGIEKIQANVTQKLNQLSDKGEWHVLSFNRQLDRSGLESIQMKAQARLPQTELGNLRGKAKSISKPGETFTIDNVHFTPSNEEIRDANTALRNNLYLQAKAEIENLNKLYPDQKYYLHEINFISLSPISPMPMNAMVRAEAMSASPPLSVGNKANLQAMVTVASMPAVVAQKLS